MQGGHTREFVGFMSANPRLPDPRQVSSDQGIEKDQSDFYPLTLLPISIFTWFLIDKRTMTQCRARQQPSHEHDCDAQTCFVRPTSSTFLTPQRSRTMLAMSLQAKYKTMDRSTFPWKYLPSPNPPQPWLPEPRRKRPSGAGASSSACSRAWALGGRHGRSSQVANTHKNP
jgi:hypothetical protein